MQKYCRLQQQMKKAEDTIRTRRQQVRLPVSGISHTGKGVFKDFNLDSEGPLQYSGTSE